MVSTGYTESDKHGADAGYCLSIRYNNQVPITLTPRCL